MTLRSVSTKAVLFSLRMKLWSMTLTARSAPLFLSRAWNTCVAGRQPTDSRRSFAAARESRPARTHLGVGALAQDAAEQEVARLGRPVEVDGGRRRHFRSRACRLSVFCLLGVAECLRFLFTKMNNIGYFFK